MQIWNELQEMTVSQPVNRNVQAKPKQCVHNQKTKTKTAEGGTSSKYWELPQGNGVLSGTAEATTAPATL